MASTIVKAFSARGYGTVYDATVTQILSGVLTGYIEVIGWRDVTKFWGGEGQTGRAWNSTCFDNLPADSTQVPNVIPTRWRDKNGGKREWALIQFVIPDTDTQIEVVP